MRRPERGFTLIEALVALVVMAGAGMSLFSWINASITSLWRVEDANARSDAMANVIEYMQAVNPMLTPTGNADLGQYRIEWAAVPATPLVDGSGYPQGISLHQLALYETRIRAAKPGDPVWFELTLVLAGHKKVRDSVSPLLR